MVAELNIYVRQGFTFHWESWASWSACSGPCEGLNFDRRRRRTCNSDENGGVVDEDVCEQIYVGEEKEQVEACGAGPCRIGTTHVEVPLAFALLFMAVVAEYNKNKCEHCNTYIFMAAIS